MQWLTASVAARVLTSEHEMLEHRGRGPVILFIPGARPGSNCFTLECSLSLIVQSPSSLCLSWLVIK